MNDEYCCKECFNNQHIEEFIVSFDNIGECDYCKSTDVYIVQIETLGNFLRENLSKSYVNATTNDIPYHMTENLSESIISVLRHTECIFSESIELDDTCEKLINDAFSFSGPSPRDIANGAVDEWEGGHAEILLYNAFYAPDNNRFAYTWAEFKETVKHGNRFFDIDTNKTREEMLDIFSNFFNSMEVIIPKNTPIYRARKNPGEVVKDAEKQALQCGPPPANSAISLRMNPTGISYFYGAENKKTCVDEIRASK